MSSRNSFQRESLVCAMALVILVLLLFKSQDIRQSLQWVNETLGNKNKNLHKDHTGLLMWETPLFSIWSKGCPDGFVRAVNLKGLGVNDGLDPGTGLLAVRFNSHGPVTPLLAEVLSRQDLEADLRQVVLALNETIST